MVANEAEVAIDAVATVQLVACAELDTTPEGRTVGANEADTATLAVPSNDPVNPPVETVDPVTANPLGKVMNPLIESAYDAVTA